MIEWSRGRIGIGIGIGRLMNPSIFNSSALLIPYDAFFHNKNVP